MFQGLVGEGKLVEPEKMCLETEESAERPRNWDDRRLEKEEMTNCPYSRVQEK